MCSSFMSKWFWCSFLLYSSFSDSTSVSRGSVQMFQSTIVCLLSVENFYLFSIVVISKLKCLCVFVDNSELYYTQLSTCFSDPFIICRCSFEHLAIPKCHYMHVILNSLFSFPLFVISHAFCFDVVPVSYLVLIL